jgi:hypothetical protein
MDCRRLSSSNWHWFAGACISLCLLLQPARVLGDDVTIKSSVTTTNGGYVIDGDDNFTVTSEGAIQTLSDPGISTLGTDNTVINEGVVGTIGAGASAIVAGDFHTMLNYGTLVTAGDGAFGIIAQNNNLIANIGGIQTGGAGAFGIFAQNNNLIVNIGSIETDGVAGFGILAVNNNTVRNSGTIATSGLASYGILVVDGNFVDTTVRVTTTGDIAHGILARNGNLLVNSGTLLAGGIGAAGITAGDNNLIRNNGRIVSAQSDAIALGANNELVLSAPAFIGGRLALGANTRVTITTGRSHSILWDLSSGTLAGGAPVLIGNRVPVFYDPGTMLVATYDPTVLDVFQDALGDVSDALASTASRGLQTGDGWWVSAFGAAADHSGDIATLDRTVKIGGLATGHNFGAGSQFSAGLLAGIFTTQAGANSPFLQSFKSDGTGFFAGFQGHARQWGSWLDFGVIGGGISHDDRRFVNHNLAVAGVSWADNSHGSWFAIPHAAIGADFAGRGAWTITPSAQLRYAAGWI